MRARVAVAKSRSSRITTPAAHLSQPSAVSAVSTASNSFAAPKRARSFSEISISAPGRQNPISSEAPHPRTDGPAQARAGIGATHSPLEREAEHAAEQVLRMPSPAATVAEPAIPRQSAPADLQARKEISGPEPADSQARKEISDSSAAGVDAPDNVLAALRSPGQPLDGATRSFFEPRFGYNFANVRVSADSSSAKSAEELRAKSYTGGSRIVFAANEYQPGTAEGRRLLAHELAHVVQQGRARRTTNVAIGGLPNAGGVLGALTPAPQHVQRAPQKNWAGKFSDDVYRPISEPNVSPPRYAAHIELSFLPEKTVDAENIAFVQTAQMLITDREGADPRIHRPYYVQTDKDESVFSNRLLSDDPETLGTHIDQSTKERTPLYSMTGASDTDIKSKKKTASPLAASTPTKFSDFGFRTDKKGTKAATMTDQPGLDAEKGASAFGKFETTALAVEGAQRGTYYGTVKWGFTKAAGETEAKLDPFVLSQSSAPSDTFFEAAKRFGASTTTAGEQSVPLPTSGNRYANADVTLRSSPDKGSVAKISLNTMLETLDDSSNKGWVKVIVAGGDHSGAMGWLKASELSTAPTTKIVPKKHH